MIRVCPRYRLKKILTLGTVRVVECTPRVHWRRFGHLVMASANAIATAMAAATCCDAAARPFHGDGGHNPVVVAFLLFTASET